MIRSCVFKAVSMIAVLALTGASSASAGPAFMYSTGNGFFSYPSLSDPFGSGVKVSVDGGGFVVPVDAPSDLTMVMLGTASLSTSTGKITDYGATPPTTSDTPTMGGPIMTNISVVLKTSQGTGGIVIGGILTGTADYTTDLSHLSSSLTFDVPSASVTIGNELFTLALNAFPTKFTTEPGNFVTDAPIYGTITVTELAPPPVVVPEPGTVSMILIGSGITGAGLWTRRRKTSRSIA